MADDLLALADLVANTMDISEAEVSDLLRDAPFFAQLPVVESTLGDTHKYVKETGAPVVGFRAPNAGRDFDHSVDTLVTVTLKTLDFSWAVDKAIADAWIRGGPEALIAREGRRHLRSAFFEAEEQYINGTNNDASGFSGLAQSTGHDDSDDEMVYDVGDAAALSSVWLIRQGDDDCVGVMSGDGVVLGETIVQDMLDGSSKHYPAYYTPGCTWLGIQVGGARSVARICNIGSGSLTDDIIYEALSLFPAGRPPNRVVMNRRSLKDLRASRTATNATGTPAPIPQTVAEGIPIIVTDAISNAETALTPA